MEETAALSINQKKQFSWTALALTPIWLLRNGFLLTFISYMILAIYFWPASLLISILFFIEGYEWSWGKGKRWNSIDEFLDSQYVWNLFGKLSLLFQVVGLVALFYSGA
jgi:hypothetical protein